MTAFYAAYLTVTVLGTVAAAAIFLAIIGYGTHYFVKKILHAFNRVQQCISIQNEMTEDERRKVTGIIYDVKRRIRERKHHVTKPENESETQD